VWPFRAKATNSDLLERLSDLERRFKQLEGEWDDHYDKQRRMLGRIVKSHAKLEEKDAAAVDSEIPSGLDGAVPEGNGHGFLTPRQKQLQQQILRRRAGGA
jgi:hypothetical protein